MIVVVGDRPCPRVGVGGAGVGIGIHAVPQMRLVTIAAPYGLRFGCCLLRSSRATAAAAVSYHYSTATTTTNNDDGGGASYAGRLPRCMFNEPSSRSSLSSFLFFCFLLIERSCCWVSFCPHTPDLWGRIGRLQQASFSCRQGVSSPAKPLALVQQIFLITTDF